MTQIEQVKQKVNKLKRAGWKLTNDTPVMEYEELNDKGEVIKVRPVTWGEVKKQVKKLK